LVIGYGNTLRQDDGAGPRVAEQVAALGLPGVSTLVCPQLSPEHAEAVAQAAAVVFVDASATARQGGRLRPVEPDASPQLMTHAADPGKMLALAREVYGQVPRAWVLPVPGQNFGFGEEVSAGTRLGIAAAVRAVGRLARREQGLQDRPGRPSANPPLGREG
jgi:hydrogenase maturation protease